MDVHCTVYKHTHTQEWIKQLKLVHPNPEVVVPPYLHTWGPVWPDPTADSHSGRRRWDSCSCATWSGAACRFWSAPSGTAGTNTQTPICMSAQQPHRFLLPLGCTKPGFFSLTGITVVFAANLWGCSSLFILNYPLCRRLPARLFTIMATQPWWRDRCLCLMFHNTNAIGVL